MISEENKSKLRRLMETRQKRDEDKKALELSEAAYREAEAEVFEALNDSVEGTIKVPLGPPWGTVSFRTRETTFGNIYDEEAALEYFEQRMMMDEISAPKFVKRRINEIVRDLDEQGLELPPGVAAYKQRGVTITRQKG